MQRDDDESVREMRTKRAEEKYEKITNIHLLIDRFNKLCNIVSTIDEEACSHTVPIVGCCIYLVKRIRRQLIKNMI